MSELDVPPPAVACAVTQAAFFDLDRTIISRPAVLAFSRPLYDAGLVSGRLIARGIWANAVSVVHACVQASSDQRMERLRQRGLEIVRGWDSEVVKAIVRATVEEVIAPILYPARSISSTPICGSVTT